MKLTDNKKPREPKFTKHVKSSSQVQFIYSNPSNTYLSRLMNQRALKNKSLLNENLPNLQKSIENIFSNEEKKKKFFNI